MAEKLEIIIGAQDKFSGVFGKLRSALPSLKTLAIGAAGGVAALGGSVLAVVKSTATAYDSVQKFSDQLGVSTEFLSRHGMAAEFSGIKQETFNKSIQMLQVRIGEANRGLGQGKEVFDALGVSVADASGKLKTAETIMPELAEALHNVEDATMRAEYASKIFGQRGISMLQMFKDGQAGLEAMTDEAERFGLVISAKAGANAAEFNDMLTRVWGSLKGVKYGIAEEVMPTLTGLGNRFAEFIAENREGIVQFAENFLFAMGGVAEKGAYAAAVLVDSWRGLQMTWEVLQIGFAGFSEALWTGIDFLTEKLLAFMEAVNVGGVFDDAIAGVQNYKQINTEAIAEMQALAVESQAQLNDLAAEGLATEKVDEYTEKIKTALAEIRAAGTAPIGDGEEGPQGISPFSSANMEVTQANMERLQEMYDEHFLSEAERLDNWYAEEQNKYKANQEALAKLQAIYEKKKAAIKKKSDKEQASSEDWKQQTIYGIQKTGAFKGFDLSKAAAIPEIMRSTHTGAIKAYEAMAGIPIIGPALGAAAAAAVMLYGGARLGVVEALGIAGAPHGGLDYVPKEATYLLDRGERVLSPVQNRDLTEFLASGGGNVYFGDIIIQTAEPLDEINWEDMTEDEIIPAMRKLAEFGITV